jgi:serine protease AprX
MRKLYFLFVLFFTINAYSQEDAWVYFNAKPNAQYYFDNPLQMLSQRALDRRTRQNIVLDFKDIPLHQPYVDQVFAAIGITVKAKSKWLNALHIRGTQTDIKALISLPFVDHVQFANHSLNPSGRIASGEMVNTTITNKFQDIQVDYNYGNSGTQIKMLNAQVLHQNNYTGSGIMIAIMDGGFPGVDTASPFERLRTNNLILGGYDFVNRTTNPYTGISHGTNVLSTMGGYFDTKLIGTAPDASYYLFITEDGSSENPIEESNWVEAAEMADSLGVDIINTSLGYFIYDNPAYNYTYADMTGDTSFISRGASIAYSRGMICVTSAGNSGASANPHISVPADVASTLTVGAVNSSETLASFSSIGPSFDGRIKPDVMDMGVLATVASPTGTIGTSNGTSFSSPIIAGAIASLWSAFPNKTNSEIIQLVKASSDRYLNPNNQYGYGVPDFQAALNNTLTTTPFYNTIFNIYPNASSGIITISCSKNELGSTIKLFNSLGKIILEKRINSVTESISIENFSNGVYYYNIASADKNQSGKILKK